ncbi:hypothetical protein V1502_18300 [Bacillus sp. SCS-153A]|uniref:hypothetical protein n=1 Tax=Rossellomorea sedimentorum TaxID=3115294 RepID=UPI0039065068
MSQEEYSLYTLCEEFYEEIKSRFGLKETTIQLARRITQKLNHYQIKRIVDDIQIIKNRGTDAASYFCTLLMPLV